jgi:hypothetical protein
VDEEEKNPYILQSEVGKAIKQTRALKLLGEHNLKIMTQPIKNIHETGEWPQDFIKVTITALKKKQKATKCSDNRTINVITHTAKTVSRILRRRI